jgi:ABC-type amino acid transport substrate-binding protein
VGHFIAVNKASNPEDVQSLQSAFLEIKRSGAADRIYEKYLMGTTGTDPLTESSPMIDWD